MKHDDSRTHQKLALGGCCPCTFDDLGFPSQAGGTAPSDWECCQERFLSSLLLRCVYLRGLIGDFLSPLVKKGRPDAAQFPVKSGFGQVHRVIVPGALNLVKTPFPRNFVPLHAKALNASCYHHAICRES
jgi:hypothetical protein